MEKWNDKGKQIVGTEANATIATTKIQNIKREDREEGECLFHSQMWVKDPMIQFIVDSEN